MSNPYKSRAFLQLQSEWYAKLKKKGFEDIEEPNSPNEMLKRWHSFDFPRKDQYEVDRKRQYYLDASWFLEHHKGFTRVERRVWTLPVDGFSIREISSRINLQKDKVHKIIKKLRGDMNFAKEYEPDN